VSQRLRRLVWQFILVGVSVLGFAGPALAQGDAPGDKNFTWGCASVAIILGFLVLVLTLGASRKKRPRRRRSRPRQTVITPEPDYGPSRHRTRTTRRRRAPSRRRSRY